MEWFWLTLAVGIGFGIVGTLSVIALIAGRWYIGTLREDRSDPSEPYYFMEIPKGGMRRLSGLNHVILNVKRENYVKEDS
jgi:hypothetical protein